MSNTRFFMCLLCEPSVRSASLRYPLSFISFRLRKRRNAEHVKLR